MRTREKPLTGFHLKWIALLAMVIDHIGVVFPSPEFLRAAGRLAFPIYAFLIAEGCRRTRSRKRYLLGLGAFALISEVPFDLAFGVILPDTSLPHISFLRHTNVFFTLFFAAAAIHIYETLRRQPWHIQAAGTALGGAGILLEGAVVVLTRRAGPTVLAAYLWILGVLAACFFLPERKAEPKQAVSSLLAAIPTLLIFFQAEITHCDYGAFGVLLIAALYLAGTPKRASIVLAAGMALFYGPLYPYGFRLSFLLSALAAAGLTALYNGQRGAGRKWFFYWAYPGHIALLAALRLLLKL